MELDDAARMRIARLNRLKAELQLSSLGLSRMFGISNRTVEGWLLGKKMSPLSLRMLGLIERSISNGSTRIPR